MGGTVLQSGESNTRRIVQAVNDAFAGRSNAVGTVTLRANETTTTVTATNCGPDSRVFLEPVTDDAHAARAAGARVSLPIGQGFFVIVHPSDASVDQTFHWVALG